MIKKEKVTNDIIKKLGKEYECPICCDNFTINEFIIITGCKHYFHYKCIKQAIERNILNCPICRRSIRNIEINIYNYNRNNLREIGNNENNENFLIKAFMLPIKAIKGIQNFIISIVSGIIYFVIQILMFPIYLLKEIINLIYQILMLPIYLIKELINLVIQIFLFQIYLIKEIANLVIQIIMFPIYLIKEIANLVIQIFLFQIYL